MVFAVGAASGQLRSVIQLPPAPAKSLATLPAKRFSTGKAQQAPLPPIRTSLIHPAFAISNFGFFCNQELQLEKKIKFPFRFRLGSVFACDRLEGKRVSITQ